MEALNRLAERFGVPHEKAPIFVRVINIALRDANNGPAARPDAARIGKVRAFLHQLRLSEGDELPFAEDVNGMTAENCLMAVTGMDLLEWHSSRSEAERDADIDKAESIAEVLCMSSGRTPGRSDGRIDAFVSALYHTIKVTGGDPGTCSKAGSDQAKGRFLDELEWLVRRGLLVDIVPASDRGLASFKQAERRWRDAN